MAFSFYGKKEVNVIRHLVPTFLVGKNGITFGFYENREKPHP